MPLPEGIGDFIRFDRNVVDAFNALDERTRFSKGLYAWAGFRQTSIPYTPHERHAGSSSFNFWKLWLFALTGFMSFTTVPLRIWSYLGLFVALMSIVHGSYVAGIGRASGWGRWCPAGL